MQALSLEKLKRNLKDHETKDQELRNALRHAVGDAYEGIAEVISDRQSVTLRCKHKAMANEFYMRQEEIKKLLPAWVKELRIR